jgi:hypothetical protein
MVGGAAEEQTIGHALVGRQVGHAAVSALVVAEAAPGGKIAGCRCVSSRRLNTWAAPPGEK